MNALIRKISNPPEQRYAPVEDPHSGNTPGGQSTQLSHFDIEKSSLPPPPNNDDVDPNIVNRRKEKENQPHQKPQTPSKNRQNLNIPMKSLKRKLSLRSLFRCCDSSKCETFCACLAAILFLALILSVLALLIALMVIYLGRDPTTDSLAATLNHIILNLRADPIMSLEIVPSGSDCPSGYDQMPLGRWPGTVDGCDCTAGRGVNAGACPVESDCTTVGNDTYCTYYTPPDCHEIAGVPGVNLPTWDNKKWCATRLKLGDTYMKNSTCPVDFKECWAGNCVRNDLDCPITDVTFTNDVQSAESRPYGSSGYYTPRREQGKTSMIDAVITINDVPCFNPEEDPIGAPSYVLLDDEPEGCKTYGLDSIFSWKLRRMLQEQLLRGNSVPQIVFDLPGYTNILQITETFLVARRKILMGSHSTCLNMDLDQTTQLLKELPYLDKVIKVCSILAISLHGVMIGILMGLGCAGAKEKALVVFYIVIIAEIIIYLVMALLVHNSLGDMEGVKYQLIDLNHHNCFPIGQPGKVVTDIITLITGTGEVVRRLAFSLLGVSAGLLLILSAVGIFIAKKYN